METLKKYWLAFVAVIGILVGIFLVRPTRKTSTGISELQKAEEKIREKAIEQQKTDAEQVTKDITKLNENRAPDIKVDSDKDIDALAEEYKKL